MSASDYFIIFIPGKFREEKHFIANTEGERSKIKVAHILAMISTSPKTDSEFEKVA